MRVSLCRVSGLSVKPDICAGLPNFVRASMSLNSSSSLAVALSLSMTITPPWVMILANLAWLCNAPGSIF